MLNELWVRAVTDEIKWRLITDSDWDLGRVGFARNHLGYYLGASKQKETLTETPHFNGSVSTNMSVSNVLLGCLLVVAVRVSFTSAKGRLSQSNKVNAFGFYV